jgi:hypothetical protein
MKRDIVLFSCVIFLIYTLSSCNNKGKSFADKKVQAGFELAKKYCASCHQFPEPSLLDKNTWEKYVLPKMAPYVGFELFAQSYIASDTGIGLKIEDWNNIYRYFLTQAPSKSLQREKEVVINSQTSLFDEIPLSSNLQAPSTTLLLVDSVKHEILFGDGMLGKLYAVSKGFKILDSLNVGTGISNVRIQNGARWILTMGVMHPSDEKLGQLVVSNANEKSLKIFDSLRRPVYATYADLNNDHQEDIVLSEFGDRIGALSWMENKGRNNYQKHILRSLPGCIKSVVYDFNHDGRPDIMAMMAQGDEGMFIYYNEGNGAFKEQRILRFPPSYGSNSFELADFNKDGFLDIVTSNGDNGDYPPILKAYHGIRIFLNNGHNEFEQQLFLPVNGIGKVIARDFDADGDLDLASIAYFADFRKNPAEAFIYWQNEGGLKFSPHTIKNVSVGRWITMDAGDYDGDGDIDIILGNADFRLGDVPDSLKRKWDNFSPPLLVLKNTLTKDRH